MARKRGIPKISVKNIDTVRFDFSGLKFISGVGEKKNYNFHPEVTEYALWPFSTNEWIAAEGKYRARAMVQR